MINGVGKIPRTCLFLDVYQELLPDACYLDHLARLSDRW
jgi:hypothetical protein